MVTLGVMLLVAAGMLALLGLALVFGSRLGLGALPGDLRFRGEGWSCYVPIATSILLSLALSLLLTLFARWMR